MPVGATGDNVAVARLHAEAYARARGFELPASKIGVLARAGSIDGEFLGVTFDVVVGKGDIHLDQRVPGVLDRWRWSAEAMNWWRDIFNRADGREGRILSLVDAQDRRRLGRITGVRPVSGDPHAVTIEGQFLDGEGGDPSWLTPGAVPNADVAADQRPPWARRADPDFTDSED